MSFLRFFKRLYERPVNGGLQLSRKLPGEDSTRQKTEQEEIDLIYKLLPVIEHDIRTPFATINNLVDSLRKKFSNNPEIVNTLESIESQIDEIKTTISLIDILRVKSIPEEDTREIEAESLINRAIRQIKKSRNFKPIITVDIKKKMLFVKGSYNLLVKAFIEILLELSKYANTIKIEIRGTDDESVIIEIIYNYATAKRDVFLERFYSTENNKHEPIFFLIKRIIKIHSGKIEIKSTSGNTESISISLPRYFIKKMRKFDEEKENTSDR